jgi:sugar/nucleoside kinase (ribokinase family)
VPSTRLLCAGEAFEDLVFVGLERLPALGEEVRTSQFCATIGGGAVITAVAAARLGVEVALLSALSDSAAARLRTERMRITNLRRPGERHAVTAALSTGDDRAFVTFDGMNAQLGERLIAHLRSARATHVHLALYPRNTARWTRCVGALRRRHITTSWDFGWNAALAADAGLAPLIDALDIVFVNDREAALYAHVNRFEDALLYWRNRRPIVAIKRGADGSCVLHRGAQYDAKAPAVKAVDTTGAGDAFNAGFLAAWLRGTSLERCLAAGNRIGAASTRKAGGIDALPARQGRNASRAARHRSRP